MAVVKFNSICGLADSSSPICHLRAIDSSQFAARMLTVNWSEKKGGYTTKDLTPCESEPT